MHVFNRIFGADGKCLFNRGWAQMDADKKAESGKAGKRKAGDVKRET